MSLLKAIEINQCMNQWMVIFLRNSVGQTWLDGTEWHLFPKGTYDTHMSESMDLSNPPASPPPASLFLSLYNGRYCYSIQTEDLIGLSLRTLLWKPCRRETPTHLQQITPHHPLYVGNMNHIIFLEYKCLWCFPMQYSLWCQDQRCCYQMCSVWIYRLLWGY